ncbi:MAG: glycosyltransferase, partial [Anaeromassilibacillus sp.]
GDELHIVSCCHISPVKRVELLAQALSLLEDSGLKLHWTHFGGGDGLDALKAYAKEHLSFMDCQLAGPIQNEALMRYYQQHPADLFVNTSSSEGLPVSIMEACSFGIPAIATDVGGTSEIVQDGKTGFLLPMEFAPNVLAEQIVAFSRLPQEQRQALRANCRKVWEEQFFGERNFTRFAEAIRP